MGSRYEVEVKLESARDLKNVNWRNGDLHPYAVAWVDPAAKASTKVDVDNGCDPVWDEKLLLPLGPLSLDAAVLYVDIVHADASDGVKPLVGSARLPLREVVDEAGIGGRCSRSLQLKRPSGRPHGRLNVKVTVREPARYQPPPPASYPPPYGQPTSRDFGASSYGYGQPPYAAAQPAGYPYSAPPYGGYGAPPPPAGYGYGAPPQPAAYGGYGQPAAPAYGQQEEKKKSKFGMGTGLAVGAVGGVLGGLALAEGIDYVEDKITDDAAEKVENDLAYDDYGGDDF